MADVWQVRANPMVQITFQVEDGRAISLTRKAPGLADTVMARLPDEDDEGEEGGDRGGGA